ncbi:hypothetical protein N9315_03485 [Alphaproteobacteria bacterium]|nr:hypothetical protein [Alphaproteobacteria bacterium]
MEMDASGCWIIKNAQVMSEIPLRAHSEHYIRLACFLDAKDNADDDKRDDF